MRGPALPLFQCTVVNRGYSEIKEWGGKCCCVLYHWMERKIPIASIALLLAIGATASNIDA
jgi:hypothetical protein